VNKGQIGLKTPLEMYRHWFVFPRPLGQLDIHEVGFLRVAILSEIVYFGLNIHIIISRNNRASNRAESFEW